MSEGREQHSADTGEAFHKLGGMIDRGIVASIEPLLSGLGTAVRGEDRMFVAEKILREIASISAEATQKMALLAVLSAFKKGLGNSPNEFQAHVLQMLQDELNRHFAHPAKEPSGE